MNQHITATIAALLFTLIVAGIATAQDSTTLGRWVRSQPPQVQQRIGCDLPVPYSRRCWEPVFIGGRRAATIYYIQRTYGIEVTTVRHGR